ncbi:MAG TPA: hypothetical protein VGB69_05750 [Edaphobacter sp.]
MCGAEKLESASHWFVAEEQGGELRMRAWGSSKGAKKSLKHLCGQKCAQRLMDNFTASVLAGLHAGKGAAKDTVQEAQPVVAAQAQPLHAEVSQPHALEQDLDDVPVLERMGYDRATIAEIEAESWAGPVRPKEPAPATTWGAANRSKNEGESFINTLRARSQAARAYQRPA